MRQDDHLSALQSGARIHSYTVCAILGSGGFGITYRAREDVTNRDVAIKEYLPAAFAVRDRDGATVRPLSEGAVRDFEWGLERFREEAKLLIGFRHANIVPVLAYFEANGTGYLVMAFQEGTSLAELLRGTPTLSEAQVLRFMVPLLDGVEEVHRHDFLHRDIKPENIFIRSDGTPVLLDFGAARQALGEHSKTLTTLLTEGYAPFEQYAGSGNQGPWSDIYALAAVMFRCLTGKPPAEAPRRAVAKLRGTTDPMAPDFAALRARVSPDFAFAIEAAMRVVEQERPQSVAAFRELIVSPAPATLRVSAPAQRAAASTATLIPDGARRITGRHPPPWYQAERKAPRRTARLAAFGVVALVAASGAAYIGDQRHWLPEAFRRAGPDSMPSAAATPAAPPGKPAPSADQPRRAADEAKRKAEEATERRRAERHAIEDERNKAMAEYQRLQLDQFEAERRQYLEAKKAQTERPKTNDPNAPPGSGSATSSDDRARTDAEKKRVEDEERAPRAPPRLQPPPKPEPRTSRDRSREFDDWPPVAPNAPPTARGRPALPPGDTQRYGPYAPPARGLPPRGANHPGADDEY